MAHHVNIYKTSFFLGWWGGGTTYYYIILTQDITHIEKTDMQN